MIKHAFIIVAFVCLAACAGPEAPAQPAQETPIDAAAVEGRGVDTAKWWEKLPRAAWGAYSRVLPDADWFEVYRVSPGVYAIYEPGQFEEVISFLIVGEVHALLFDTGLGVAPLRPLVEQLTDLEIIVVNSHSHYDHVGGNHEFEIVAGLDNPYTDKCAAGLSNEAVGEFVRGDWLARPPSPDFDAGAYAIEPWVRSTIVKDGLVIDLGGRKLEVLETPGHAPDAICLLDRENRLLFMGDVFYLAPLYAHLEGSDFATYKASVERLAALQPDVDLLMTAHNVPAVKAAYLTALRNAFEAVEKGTAKYVETDGAHEYGFDGFSIIVPVPAPANGE